MSFKSIFDGIANAEHSFVAYAEKELASLEKSAPAIERVISAGLKYIGPALQIVATTEAGSAAGAAVGKVVADAQEGLTAASSLIYDFGPSPTVSSVFSSVSSNLNELLTAGHVTNPTSVKAVNTAVSNLNLLASAVQNTVAAAA